MDKLGKYTLGYLVLFVATFFALIAWAPSVGGGHPPLGAYVTVYMAVVAWVTMPLATISGIVGIVKALRAQPRYNFWKSIVSLLLSWLKLA